MVNLLVRAPVVCTLLAACRRFVVVLDGLLAERAQQLHDKIMHTNN